MFVKREQRSEELVSILMQIWYRSVKATHLFLSVDDITKISSVVEKALKQIDTLIVEYDNSKLVGFMGIEDDKIEMLFLDTHYIRNGYGRKLIQQAINDYNVVFVDVNEQNPNAVAFYKTMGFRQFDRSEVDDQGNKFPILNLKLE